ncbi:MAG TPA: hypothetical protein VFG68_04105 [Fimbriiglobus sp.]|nr:hypothetical protein [Fimbriiglobus sp.]
MTTHEDWEKEVARARRWAELDDDPGGILAAGLTVAAQKFPVPDTDGLPPEEAEAVLDRWRAEVYSFLDAQRASASRQHRVSTQ